MHVPAVGDIGARNMYLDVSTVSEELHVAPVAHYCIIVMELKNKVGQKICFRSLEDLLDRVLSIANYFRRKEVYRGVCFTDNSAYRLLELRSGG